MTLENAVHVSVGMAIGMIIMMALCAYMNGE